MFKVAVIASALTIVAHPTLAGDADTVVGTWKVASYEIETQRTGQREPVMGANPSGYAIFTAEGRVFFILTGEGRKPARTEQERIALYNTLIAYSGTYSLERDRWITKVDVAWNPEWVGTSQIRGFKLEGDHLQVMTPWRIMPSWPELGMARSVVVFERAK